MGANRIHWAVAFILLFPALATAAPPELPATEAISLPAQAGAIKALAYSRDGNFLATAGTDGGITTETKPGVLKLWNAATGQELAVQFDHPGTFGLRAVALSSDGTFVFLATAGTDGAVKVWEVATGKVVYENAGHHTLKPAEDEKAVIFALTLSADGSLLASGDYPGNLLPHSVGKKAKPTRVVMPRDEFLTHAPIYSLAYSPNGKVLAIGAGGRIKGVVLSLRDPVSGKELATLAHPDTVDVAVFSPDGKKLATGVKSVVRIWEPKK